ncbi:putative quinol monooxygenase [Saccharopolyspora sp. ID03-671]|uniref:putative quinol monooxygenase n=1 Tax=Saccharopolyspora sp. ID03-671 TaxID=3073066 RepID=UPI003247EE0E
MFGHIASMKAKPGKRDEVVALLVGGVENLRQHGCESYVVATSATDDDTIWVTEVWRSREHHAASLELPETRKAIGEAMPLLTGEFSGQATSIAGGLGVLRADWCSLDAEVDGFSSNHP